MRNGTEPAKYHEIGTDRLSQDRNGEHSEPDRRSPERFPGRTGTDRNGPARNRNGPERPGTELACRGQVHVKMQASLDKNQAWNEQLEPVTVGTGPERNVSRFRGGAQV